MFESSSPTLLRCYVEKTLTLTSLSMRTDCFYRSYFFLSLDMEVMYAGDARVKFALQGLDCEINQVTF